MFFKNGIPVTQITVGDTVTYNVPGYSQIWLYQLKNGVQQFNGVYSVPVTYTYTAQDVGHYDSYAYDLTGPNQTFGNLIEQSAEDVVPVGGGSILGTSGSNLLLYGGLALAAWLLLRR